MRLAAFCIILLMMVGACGRSDTFDKKLSGSQADNVSVPAPIDLWTADSLAYRRWGSPASPYRDEARYIRFLDSLLVVDSLPDGLRRRALERRRIAKMNRTGLIAADFSYLSRDGSRSRLHDLKSPLTLLIFYDPECPHCNDILRRYAASKTMKRAITEMNLTVIAIYAEGKREVWDKTKNDLPDNWLVGYDLTGILDAEIYDLPAMPTPYLLDKDKRVILKDPDPKLLIRRIGQLGNGLTSLF